MKISKQKLDKIIREEYSKLTEDKFIAFYKKDRVTVNAKSLWDAKKKILAKLKVPKKDVGLVSVLNKTEYDKQKFRFEGKITEAIGRGMKWEDLKSGTSIEYTGGTTYVVTKIDKNKLQMSLKRRGKVGGGLFAPRAKLDKSGFESQVKTGLIKYLVNTNPREVKEGKLNEFNKAHFLNLIEKEIESLKGQIIYAKKALSGAYGGVEKWEAKEFKAIIKDKIKDLRDTEKHYKRVQKLKEGKLTEKWDSPQGFSSKEAKSVIDGALKNYAKDLRKVQHRVIKDWMSKAKSGVIDFFDIHRGLTTGDISRAHPYETEFLHKVLTRDKIVDRFRKYFGGNKGKRQRRK